MKLLPFFILFLFIVTIVYSQELTKLTINVDASNIDDTSQIFIAGNQIEFGAWQPDKISLKKADDDSWTSTFSFAKGTRLQFKFTKGSWSKEALDSNGYIPPNHEFVLNADTTVYYIINKWRDQQTTEAIYPGQITGDVRYHEAMSYPGLLDRDVIVWLPPGYSEHFDQRYKVLYMQDGQNIVDPATNAVTHVDWQIDEALDSLIRKGEVDPTIVVGIYNTSNRTAEYTPTDTANTYMKFVVEKLKPFIDKTYRTKNDREHTAVAGSSAGGIISFMLLWQYNDVFSKAICMSPAFKIIDSTRNTNINYVDDVANYNGEMKNFRLYIDNGGLGVEAILQPGVDDMIKALKEKGYQEKKDFIYIQDDEAKHTESAWAERLPNALKYIFGKN